MEAGLAKLDSDTKELIAEDPELPLVKNQLKDESEVHKSEAHELEAHSSSSDSSDFSENADPAYWPARRRNRIVKDDQYITIKDDLYTLASEASSDCSPVRQCNKIID